MRDEIRQVVERFRSRELPRDAVYFERLREDLETLITALRKSTRHNLSFEPPIDLYNFYHLQLPLDREVQALPLISKPRKVLRGVAQDGRSAHFLHVLLSTHSRWTCTYWETFLGPEFKQEFRLEDSGTAEKELLAQVQKELERHGWAWLPPAEGSEPVPDMEPLWPHLEGPVLVRHVLCPGCD
jgi:hypothetical protein